MTTSATTSQGEYFFLDAFAERQWDDPNYKGGRISASKEVFTQRVNEHYAKEQKLADGYAPFCKHVFVPNFVGLPVQAVKITQANKSKIEHGYIRRTPKELPVLARWIPEAEFDGEVPVAKMLDIILYSREQIVAERVAQGDRKEDVEKELPDVEWGIISIKAQDEDHEIPMQPITMMRNALGKEEGGSGVPMDRTKYEESVQYWDQHVTIQA